jgi:hypothetical protein
MSEIVRLARATGVQLQQAAKHARLIETPNMPYGFGNAYYAAVPSPMQEQILRKGLQSAGINYLKVEEQVTPASEADRFNPVLQTGLKQLIKAAKQTYQVDVTIEIRVAGNLLYAVIKDESDSTDVLKCAKHLVKGRGFEAINGRVWTKVVRFKRGKSFIASVEAAEGTLMLTVYKGA